MLFITEFELECDVLDVEPPRLDFGEVENVVDNGEQRRAGVVDLADVIPLFGSQIRPQTQMRETDDRVHRRTDLVAHVGEELGLCLGSILRCDLGFRQRRLDLGQFGDIDDPTEQSLLSLKFHVHESGEAVADFAIGAAELNAEIADDSLATKFIQQRAALFWINIEIRDGRSHSERKHFLGAWIGKAGDVVGRYRHPHRRGVEYSL